MSCHVSPQRDPHSSYGPPVLGPAWEPVKPAQPSQPPHRVGAAITTTISSRRSDHNRLCPRTHLCLWHAGTTCACTTLRVFGIISPSVRLSFGIISSSLRTRRQYVSAPSKCSRVRHDYPWAYLWSSHPPYRRCHHSHPITNRRSRRIRLSPHNHLIKSPQPSHHHMGAAILLGSHGLLARSPLCSHGF